MILMTFRPKHLRENGLAHCQLHQLTPTARKAQMAKVVVEVTYNSEEEIVEQGAAQWQTDGKSM